MELNPYSYEFHTDPYPTYRWLRDHAPVYRNDELDFWALSRYQDVVAAHLDPDVFSSAEGTSLELMGPDNSYMRNALPMIIFMDPPRQTRLRKLVNRVFTPRAVTGLEPTVRKLAAGYLDQLAASPSRQADVVRDFAGPLPIEVISTMLGIPEGDRQTVRQWVDDSLHHEKDRPEPSPRALRAMAKSVEFYFGLVAERRREPRDDMLSGLLQASVLDDAGQVQQLTDDEIVGFCALLAAAGAETVTKLLANAIVLFHQYPEERRSIVADPTRIAAAFEEILRIHPPSQFQGRWTTRAVRLHGVTMPAGAKVALLTGAACRDEREYPDPDRFVIDRPPHLAIGFGHGLHACLGAALARLEGRIALEEWHARIPDYEVDDDRLERVHMSNVHGYAAVPVSW
jgi:cytochrome P450